MPATLDTFLGLSRKRPATENATEDVSSPSKLRKTDLTESTPKKCRDSWNGVWTKQYPWLKKVTENGKIYGVCQWCKDAGRTNNLATTGTSNLQSSAFSRHEGTKDHLPAIQAKETREKKNTKPTAIEKAVQIVDSSTDACKAVQMRTMYCITKNGIAQNQYGNIITLQRDNGVPELQDSSKIYTSEEAKMDMLDAINSTLEDTVDLDIRSSDYLGLIIDESTDITVHKKLNVYIKCLQKDSKEPVVHFVDCICVPDGKAETICDVIVDLFKKKEIPIEKLATLASDGAAVMTGQKSGVGVRLREYSPKLIQIHCVAHKLALAAGQACKNVNTFDEYQTTLKQVYRFYSNSAIRYNELRAMQEVPNDKDMTYVTLKEPASFRWLSLQGAVSAVSDVYPALYSALEHQAAKGNCDAKGLFNKVKSVGFVLTTAFLKDILSVIGKLSRVLQSDDVDISVLNTMMDSTLEKLKCFERNSGPELLKGYGEINDSMYRGVKLLDKENLRISFQNSASRYLTELCENLQTRFNKDSLKVLNLINTVLNPSFIPRNSTIEAYGCDELNELATVYEDGTVDSERMKEDYFQVKVVLKSMPTLSLREACVVLVKKYGEIFPDFAALAKILLVSPITSVACERGFSAHNRIKNKGRGQLSHDTVTKLIRIAQEGPRLEEYDPMPAVKRFNSDKKRRK